MATQTQATRPGTYLATGWMEPRDPLRVENPATGELIAQVGTADRTVVRQALSDAQAAWPAWRSLPPRERGGYMLRVVEILTRRSDEIARTITLENGKPLAQSRGEMAITIDHLRWFAAEGERAYGRLVPSQAGNRRHMVLRTPIGVVGAISPWNFPLVLAMRKVAPALAAGCPVILKPASATPLCAIALAEAMEEAGVPPGVFQLIVGRASEIGAEMLENPICRKITFTGSTEVGQQLIRGAADDVTKLSLELGGHAPVLVFADADLEAAVEGALITKFRNTGQSCIASNRIYVERSIYDAFIERFVERVRGLRVGGGLEEGVDIGPLIDERALENALGHVEEAVGRGARVLCGGRRWPDSERGHFLEPTVLVDVPPSARCMHEETFAPVAPVVAFDSEEQAITMANDTRYGLAAYAFTRDLSRGWRLAEALEAGTVCINESVPATSQCPFGGMKQSGWGRELGCEGLDAFLETKHVSLRIETA
ncbi:MAG: NAD-dependent succinate-semialdehyde dehydrogenase [Planctomycetota bacterium]